MVQVIINGPNNVLLNACGVMVLLPENHIRLILSDKQIKNQFPLQCGMTST